jgi:hypothetical protein
VLLLISNQAAVDPQQFNLITHHRLVTIENVRAHAATYVGQQTRLAQDGFMMFEFIRDSLTEGAKVRIAMENDKYTVNGIQNGPCYLKVLLTKFYVETNATNFYLRESLSNLPNKMKELKGDISKFNDHVQALVLDLAAGGQTSSDLIVYLFNSYSTVEDKAFHQYITNKKEKFDEGDPAITVNSLMDMALNKFNQLKQSKAWKAKSPEEERLIALTAQLKQAKEEIAKLTKGGGRNRSGNRSGGGTSNKDSSNSDGSSSPRRATNKPPLEAWRYERKANQKTLKKDDKTYYWCEGHGYWCEHKTEDCRLKKNKEEAAKKRAAAQSASSADSDAQATSTNSDKDKKRNALKMARAFVAVSDPSDDTSSDEDS